MKKTIAFLIVFSVLIYVFLKLTLEDSVMSYENEMDLGKLNSETEKFVRDLE